MNTEDLPFTPQDALDLVAGQRARADRAAVHRTPTEIVNAQLRTPAEIVTEISKAIIGAALAVRRASRPRLYLVKKEPI